MNTQPLISLTGIAKHYASAAGPVQALSDLSFDVARGEFVAIIGKSGSGKTTLINLLTGIDSASAGRIRVDGTAIDGLNQEQLARWRGRAVGIVFQFFQLLPTLTVAENVILPMDFCRVLPRLARRPRALELLSDMGIADQADKLPQSLSGGQQQRAAIARALANDPPLIVADEPTGNLDSHTATEVMQYFAGLVRAGKTVVMVTHEQNLERYCARCIRLADGRLQS